MWHFRGARFRIARSLLAAALVYVVAATGMLGSIARAASGLESSGLVVICTMEGSGIAADGSTPVTKAQTAQHCGICQAGTAIASPPISQGVPVAAPVAAPPPFDRPALIAPVRSFEGWIGTRPPRAPPLAV
jgi:hypothetical protein